MLTLVHVKFNDMNRRNSIKLFTASASMFMINSPWCIKGFSSKSDVQDYLYCTAVTERQLTVPEDKRVPFSWKALGLERGMVVSFTFDKGNSSTEGEAWLRIAVAIDVREEKKVEARIAGKNTRLGVFDIRFSPILHTYQIAVKQEHIKDLVAHGLELELTEATKPLWIIEDTPAFEAEQNIFKPHLYVVPQPPLAKTDHFLQKLSSFNTLQPFGWMEGCVMDALYQIHQHRSRPEALTALHQHIDMFMKGNDFIHEDPRSHPHDNKISGIESTLPFAPIAQVLEDHPIFDVAIDFWKSHHKDHGAVVDSVLVSAEGNYTVAYPMAVLGVKRKDQSLIEMAVQQLLVRKDMLVDEENIYLRYYPDSGERVYKNWARGITWYTLGMVRTMEMVEPYADIEGLRSEFQRSIIFSLKYQLQNGLWPCFIDRPEITADTSGSAGIAAAIAAGVRLGYLDTGLEKAARRTWEGLQDYITPDGLLTGVAQSNRNGEEFQAGNYRVISQMGMGLMGQLYAHL